MVCCKNILKVSIATFFRAWLKANKKTNGLPQRDPSDSPITLFV